MRGYLVLALVVMSFGFSLQQNQTADQLLDVTNLCLNNSNRGPIATMFPNLTQLATRVLNNVHCPNEFRVYGSCCDITRFETVITQTRASSAAANTFLKSEYRQYVAAIRRIRDIILEIANKPTDSSDVRALQQKTAAQTLLADPFMGPYLNLRSNDALAVNFTTAMDQCWPQAQRVRESALCIQCSGRSQYFQADASGLGKLTLNSSSCQSIYGTCKIAHEKIVAFVQEMDFIFNILPSLYSTFGLNNNFALVVNRARVAQYAERFQSEQFYDWHARAEAGDAGARNEICTMFLSAGGPLLHETMSGIFTRNANFSTQSILSTIDPREEQIVNAASNITDIARNITESPYPIEAASNSSNPNETYGVSPISSPLPPQPLAPITRRRLQGVNNVSPGNLGQVIVNMTDYFDELDRVNTILTGSSGRAAQLRRSFVDPPSPFFSVAGTVIGANTLALSGGPLTFGTEAQTRAFVAGRFNGEVRPYDRPTTSTTPDWIALRLQPFLRFWTPLDLNPTVVTA